MRPLPTDTEAEAKQAPKGSLGKTMWRLFALLASPDMAKWRFRMGVALVLTLIAKIFAVYAPVFFGDGINLITEHAGQGGPSDSEAPAGAGALTGIISTFTLAFIVYAVARFLSVGAPQLRDALFAPVSQDAQRLTAVRAFAHVQTLSIGYHQTKRTGALNRIIERGARAVDFLMRFLIFNIAPTLLELGLAALVLSTTYGWEFAVIAIITVAVYICLLYTSPSPRD